jgi:hypothetical protein
MHALIANAFGDIFGRNKGTLDSAHPPIVAKQPLTKKSIFIF